MSAKVEGSIDVQAVLEAYSAAWAVHDLDRIAALHSEDTRFHNHIGGPPVVGRETVREAFAQMLEQYDNFRGEPHRVLYGDKHWVLEWTAHATLVGKDISIDAVDIIVLSDDGLIARKDTYMDAAQLQSAVA